MCYSVVANAADSLTVDTAGDHLNTAIDSTTALEVMLYDTVGPIFPAGAGESWLEPFYGSRQTEVLIPPHHSFAGIDLALLEIIIITALAEEA